MRVVKNLLPFIFLAGFPLPVQADVQVTEILELLDQQNAETVAKLFYSEELSDVTEELKTSEEIYYLQEELHEEEDSKPNEYTLRSLHFVFGMPELSDNRYADEKGASGISVLVREGFVAGFSDILESPVWVTQIWTAENREDAEELRVEVDEGEASLPRDWKFDPDIPYNYHRGTSYSGQRASLDRGHMARHAMNRAWGFDASIDGCLMTNSTPQHKDINRGDAWRELEDDFADMVGRRQYDLPFLWTISGAIFTPKGDADTSTIDIEDLARVGDGYAVPYATYKVVAHFTEEGDFTACAYLFEQAYTIDAERNIQFSGIDKNKPLDKFVVSIDDIEARTGLDFFPDLKNDREFQLESVKCSEEE